MAVFRPFRALRPRADIAARVAALPYDVYNREEALAEVLKEPLSFLKIDRAETQLPERVGPYDPRVYEKAGDSLARMIAEGLLVREEEPCYYIYTLVREGRSQTGIVGCAAIDDYLKGIVKRHENTRTEKEIDRIRHIEACQAQTGPIFLAYPAQADLKEVTEQIKETAPLYDFTAPDGVRHIVWKGDDKEAMARIAAQLARIGSLYIADGHHRAAAAVKVGLEKRAANPGYSGEEGFNFFLSVLFPHDQLRILDYNRVVRDLNGYTPESFLQEAEKAFVVEKAGPQPYKPAEKAVFGLYLAGAWYKLSARREILSGDPVDGLDVSLLQNHLLAPVLNIREVRTDQRIDFVGGIRGLPELERRVRSDMQAAFSLYPTSIAELFRVAEAGLLMPPKSTWFEPKLRSGLFMHGLE